MNYGRQSCVGRPSLFDPKPPWCSLLTPVATAFTAAFVVVAEEALKFWMLPDVSTEPETEKHPVPKLRTGNEGGVYRKIKLLIVAVVTTLAASTFVKIFLIPAANQAMTLVSLSSGVVTICESNAAKTSNTVLSICHLILPSPRPVVQGPNPSPQFQPERTAPVGPPAPVAQTPLPDPRVLKSNERIETMRLEADRLLGRKGTDYDALLKAIGEINDYDRSRFSATDRQWWPQITASLPLIKLAAQGLNITTKASIPIVVIKENRFDIDYGLVKELIDGLRQDGFNIVNDTSKAALFIEVSDVKTDASPLGHESPGSIYTEWNGSSSFKLAFVWIGGNTWITEYFPENSTDNSRENAQKGALIEAQQKARQFIAKLASRN